MDENNKVSFFETQLVLAKKYGSQIEPTWVLYEQWQEVEDTTKYSYKEFMELVYEIYKKNIDTSYI